MIFNDNRTHLEWQRKLIQSNFNSVFFVPDCPFHNFSVLVICRSSNFMKYMSRISRLQALIYLPMMFSVFFMVSLQILQTY